MQTRHIKPIETRYKGYRFRSRLEARWAVFFDSLGLKWEYEPEGFDLGFGELYLPDFWLPEMNAWVEIKGEKPDAAMMTKPRLLAARAPCAVVCYWGLPRVAWPHDTGALFAWDANGFVDGRACGAIAEAENGLVFDPWGCSDVYADPKCQHAVPIPNRSNKVGLGMWDRTYKAIAAAKGARFEFGEKGVML